nr:T9SS type A sorting domain-containing protein [Chitinophagales bacterium]
VLMYHHAFSQKENYNWVFGDSAGLNFSSSVPEYFSSSIWSAEACSSISDSAGNLLFYTNGQKVWNRFNEIMPNGDDIDIGFVVLDFGSSITQGVTIIPKPLSTNLYYIIYRANIGIKYSIVDMNMDEGYGDIIEKNIVLDTSIYQYTEKMQVIKHGNGRDYWLVFYAGDDYVEIGDNMMFISYLITSDGIEDPILVQDASPYTVPFGTVGQMKFSQDGSLLINTRFTNLDIYDFDRCSGLISNYRIVSNISDSPLYGCEISKDNKKLYVGTIGENNQGFIWQFCITDIPIEETKILIYDNEGGGGSWGKSIGSFQMAPDGKIYMPMAYSGLGYYYEVYQNLYLSVINEPNECGLACDFDTLTVWLGGNRATYSLPNICDYSLGVLIGSECDTSSTAIYDEDNEKNAIQIYPNPANEYIIISGDIKSNDIIKIYSADGRVVLHKKINTTNTKVDISMLPPGVYVIQISEDGWVKYSEKLFINRNDN